MIWYAGIISGLNQKYEASGVNLGNVCGARLWIGSCGLSALHVIAIEWMRVDVAFFFCS